AGMASCTWSIPTIRIGTAPELDGALERLDIPRTDDPDVPGNLLRVPVPPGDGAQSFHRRRIEPRANDFCRIAADNRVGRHVPRHHGGARHNGAIPDRYSRHDRRAIAEPDVVPDLGIAPHRPPRRLRQLPAVTEDGKRVAGQP